MNFTPGWGKIFCFSCFCGCDFGKASFDYSSSSLRLTLANDQPSSFWGLHILPWKKISFNFSFRRSLCWVRRTPLTIWHNLTFWVYYGFLTVTYQKSELLARELSFANLVNWVYTSRSIEKICVELKITSFFHGRFNWMIQNLYIHGNWLFNQKSIKNWWFRVPAASLIFNQDIFQRDGLPEPIAIDKWSEVVSPIHGLKWIAFTVQCFFSSPRNKWSYI